MDGIRLLIVGNPEPWHVGAHLLRAAQTMGIPVTLSDATAAFDASRLTRAIHWRLRGHRPPLFRDFSLATLETCRAFRPTHLLATGAVALGSRTLLQLKDLGITCATYLTDDPWNPAHRSRWFFDALQRYDSVFTPRRSNVADLYQLGCPSVRYVQFAYAPNAHFPDPPNTSLERGRFAEDVVFVGGADRDRRPYIAALARDSGIRMGLYGGYWERYREARPYARGHAEMATVRKAVGASKVALCLVRRANRDGHAMRSFELPAMGACMLTEDTDEHRDIFGPDGEAVLYFQTLTEMRERAKWLIARPAERARLAIAVRRRIVTGPNTYRDRLRQMLFANDH